ncbi:competence type IV pilus minor pilin ComGD [Shouchella patagoniensis]|uniref:competence type IV pilus minor pilin ComGD n=1 Tax=Shouchella patagoniensis TaxID=228576 RepID=UPI0009959172|nr:competence type IV pilus minor pilin ComGD [Shouchella patagoniensis]
MLKDNNGFTLTEMLFSLSLLSILLLLPTFFVTPNHNLTDEKATIEKLRNDLVFAQHLSMSQGKKVTILFEHNELLLFYGGREQLRFDYPIEITVTPITMDISEVAFLSNGHPQKTGSWKVSTDHLHMRFSVQIGKGRIVYREL